MEWSKKAFPNNRKVINEIMSKIRKIQDGDATDQGCKEVKKLLGDLENVW